MPLLLADTRPVALIGYRGTGKTTIAQRLALRTRWDWIDADIELELRAGKSIAAIFADEGEQAFRNLEVRVVADLTRREKTFLALGGGAVLREENRNSLDSCQAVVWLGASVETLETRIAGDGTTAARRPNLTNQGGRTEIEQVLRIREPIYRACATLEVDTEKKDPDEIADEILATLSQS